MFPDCITITSWISRGSANLLYKQQGYCSPVSSLPPCRRSPAGSSSSACRKRKPPDLPALVVPSWWRAKCTAPALSAIRAAGLRFPQYQPCGGAAGKGTASSGAAVMKIAIEIRRSMYIYSKNIRQSTPPPARKTESRKMPAAAEATAGRGCSNGCAVRLKSHSVSSPCRRPAMHFEWRSCQHRPGAGRDEDGYEKKVRRGRFNGHARREENE